MPLSNVTFYDLRNNVVKNDKIFFVKAGIYIHIPFCKSRCSYCDFATDVYKNAETVERYVSALCKEIEDFQSEKSKIQNPKSKIQIDTIYFGGGTPSLLTPKQLEKIIDSIHKKFSIEENIEFTLEMNPATVSLEKLKSFKLLGVNRASFGVQTFNDLSLKLLARGHDANEARTTFELLRESGFDNISFDLIAGLPNQTLKDWEKNLDEALKLNPEHLSLYLLEIHEGTPLAEQIRSKRQPQPDENLAGEMYELMLDKIAEKGYQQYEISNFCKPMHRSKHNSKYWRCAPVFAFGVSAHSFDGKQTRWSNERDTNKYVSLIESGETPIVEISKVDLKSEFVYLGLRLVEGINITEFKMNFGEDLIEKYSESLRRLKEFELVKISQNHLKLTRKGFLFSNEVFIEFI